MESLEHRRQRLQVVHSGFPVFEVASKLASNRLNKFWGVDTGSGLIPIPQTVENRLMHLRTVLRDMPELEATHRKWLSDKKTVSPSSVKPLLTSTISYPEDIIEGLSDLPQTAQEAYAKSSIRDAVNDEKLELGDPIIAVYESFATREPDFVDERARSVGQTALELFVFSASGRSFVKDIHRHAVDFYETEIRIRK